MVKTSDFDYDLPEKLIAATPSEKRDHSRLMVLDRSTQTVSHKHFYDILDLFISGDVLVLNDTKVIPARLIGKKTKGGFSDRPNPVGGKADILLLKKVKEDIWECLIQPAKRFKTGYEMDFDGCKATVIEEVDDSRRLVKFECEGNFEDFLNASGEIPLPPYIVERLTKEQKSDKRLTDRYQTVYADKAGASAAPTAGLHFTPELLMKLLKKGVRVVYLTLHTGVGTFRPVLTENIEEHEMFSEEYEISKITADAVNEAKHNGNRTIAVGTTVTRALEDCFNKHKRIIPVKDEAKIFIYPPYKFNVIDAMITNFHFPRSTLLMLVSAFAGKKFVFKAYDEAVKEKYRFYSFGDAMMIN